MNIRTLKSGLIAILFVLGAVPLTSAQSGGSQASKSPLDRSILVTTATVRIEPSQERVQSLGTGKAAREITVTADVAGTIQTIHFDPNTPVEQGAPLTTLNRKAEEISLRSATANYAQQRASLARFKQLAQQSSGFVSQVQLDEAQANFAVAGANLAAAQYEYDRRVIKAPFPGKVNLTSLSTGSYLAQGAPIVALTDASQLMVEFSVPENAVTAVTTGVAVRLVTPALRGRAFTGTVIAYDNAIDQLARTIQVRAKIDNPDLTLRPGMTFLVQLEPDTRALPVVPAVSITWSRSGASVWVLNAETKPQRVPVVIRRRDGDNVWVESELQAGNRVIVDGALKIRAGSTVRIKPSSPWAEG